MVDNSVNIAEETLDSIHFVELEPAQMEALSDRRHSGAGSGAVR